MSDSHNGNISEFQIYTGQSASGGKEINLGGRVVLDLTQTGWASLSHLLGQLLPFHHVTLQLFVPGLVYLWYSTTGLQRLSCGPKEEGERKEGNETTRVE